MHLRELLYPGIWAVRQLRFGTKLTLLFVVAAVPLITSAVMLVTRSLDDLQLTSAELAGLQRIERVNSVTRAVQAHRGLTNMVLLGDAGQQGARDAARTDLDNAAQVLAQALERDGANTAPSWPALAARLKGLAGQLQGLPADKAFALHTELVEDLAWVSYELAESSSLLYDPDPLTYLLMDMAVTRLPEWRDQLARLRGKGAGILSSSVVDEGDMGMVSSWVDELGTSMRSVRRTQALISEKGFSTDSFDKAVTAVQKLLDGSRERFRAGTKAAGAEAYFAEASAALQSVAAYQKAINEGMRASLEQRNADLLRKTWLVGGGAVCLLLLFVYVMLAFQVSFLADLRQVLRFMENTAQGNLQHVVRIRGKDELSDMSRAMSVMVNNIAFMVAAVRSNAALLAGSGDVLVEGNQALSERTEQQAANLEQTAASVQELAATVQGNATAAQSSSQAAQRVRATAEQGAAGMKDAVASIEAIAAGAQRMQEIVGVIDALAFQTNILALNAAVEAARAGESGRGFAVVATEVRSLAQRSAASAKEIRQLIASSSEQVGSGVGLIRKAGEHIEAIVTGVRDVAGNMAHISASSTEQSTSLGEITSAVRQLDTLTQRNAAMVEQAVTQANDLQERARVLTESVAAFKLPQGTADEARALVERAVAQGGSGRESLLRLINAPGSGLSDRDMYVFALDAEGRYAGFAGSPARVGQRVQDVAGPAGAALLRAIIERAEAGPGWVQYTMPHPHTGTPQEKMSYVVKAQGLYVGCGVYKSAMMDV